MLKESKLSPSVLQIVSFVTNFASSFSSQREVTAFLTLMVRDTALFSATYLLNLPLSLSLCRCELFTLRSSLDLTSPGERRPPAISSPPPACFFQPPGLTGSPVSFVAPLPSFASTQFRHHLSKRLRPFFASPRPAPRRLEPRGQRQVPPAVFWRGALPGQSPRRNIRASFSQGPALLSPCRTPSSSPPFPPPPFHLRRQVSDTRNRPSPAALIRRTRFRLGSPLQFPS